MDNFLTFSVPAEKWEEALPLGNGRLGAMVFGIPGREKIQLNEDSVWSGKFADRNNPAAKEALGEVRRLIDEGRSDLAEEICLEAFSGIPPAQSVYQTAGDLQINFSPSLCFGQAWSGTKDGDTLDKSKIVNYKRELDISNALHTLSFEYEGIIYKRECFISNPAQALVMRFSTNNAKGKISFRAALDRGVFYNRKGNVNNAAFISRDSDIPFCVMMKIVQKNGTQRNRGGFITVENADEALLFLDIRTGFRESEPEKCCLENLERACVKEWEQLLDEHIADYHSLYKRVQFELYDEEKENQFTIKYFNFCRYLLISCSRPGTLPANLQGIWNHHLDPPWGSDYTININTEMNYWPSGMCNLLETQEPLFDLLERMYTNGKKTAEIMYGCRGFTAHHNTNIWGDTAPRDYWIPGSYWALGAAWLSIHIWEHYEYTQDIEFLKKYFYLLKEACVFFIDFLIPGKKTNKDGKPYLIVSPSSSPENIFIQNGKPVCLSAGCEADNQILRKLFQSAIEAAEILGETDTEQFRSVLERIAPVAIAANGTIREWNEEYEEAEPGHRHFSHLFALWPAGEITLDETPKLAEAARLTIEKRLSFHGGHTGWSRSWLINFFACLKDGESALSHLNELYKDFTLPNLFNSHPPFQIDGNFGSLSGITQMLLQSRVRKINNEKFIALEILPALPSSWANGKVKGLRAKGNLELDFSWENGVLKELVINNLGKQKIKAIVRKEKIELQPGIQAGDTSIVK